MTLELEPPGKPAYSVTLNRLPADDSPLRGPSLLERRLAKVVEIEPGILYLDLARVSDPEMPAHSSPPRESLGDHLVTFAVIRARAWTSIFCRVSRIARS